MQLRSIRDSAASDHSHCWRSFATCSCQSASSIRRGPISKAIDFLIKHWPSFTIYAEQRRRAVLPHDRRWAEELDADRVRGCSAARCRIILDHGELHAVHGRAAGIPDLCCESPACRRDSARGSDTSSTRRQVPAQGIIQLDAIYRHPHVFANQGGSLTPEPQLGRSAEHY